MLIFLARPIATFAATAFSPLNVREKLMLGWAGLRGATPIWLATFPVVAGVGAGKESSRSSSSSSSARPWSRGRASSRWRRRLGLTTDEPALPRRLLESGRIREHGRRRGRLPAARGRRRGRAPVRELELPREALVNVIVRDGHAIPPRGSTEVREGDELHILVRGEVRDEVEELTERWAKGPLGRPAPPPLPRRAASQVFSVRPARAGEDPQARTEIDGIPVLARAAHPPRRAAARWRRWPTAATR